MKKYHKKKNMNENEVKISDYLFTLSVKAAAEIHIIEIIMCLNCVKLMILLQFKEQDMMLKVYFVNSKHAVITYISRK